MMNHAGVVLAMSALVFAAPGIARAQASGRVSVSGAVDYAHITEDDGFLGAGFGGAGGLQLRLTDATSLELEIGAVRHVRDLELFAIAFDAAGRPEPLPFTERREGTATFVLGLVSRTFGSGRVRPALWVGGGLMLHGGTSVGPRTAPQVPAGHTLQPGDAERRQGRRSHAFVTDGGFGVDVRMADRLTLRPFAGVRLVNTGNFGPKYIIRGGARLAVHF